ncbi:MAG: RNA 2',3'-cyclic phosphodiesterase [Planctomycetota bacterium]|jgi:2'-5' RNA ligase
MGRTRRTFIALDIPKEVRAEVATVQKRLARTGAKLRMVDPGKMHLTLKFIGEWEENRLAELCEAAERAASASPPFPIHYAGIGAFPGLRKPRVIYLAGEGDPPQALSVLHGALEQELEGLGIPRESRIFRPHITLARVKGPPGRELADTVSRFSSFAAGEGVAEEVIVFLSELRPGGPLYTRVGGAPLGG